MIYLMSDGTTNVKIGYALDPNKRLKYLKTGNPNLKLENSKPGGIQDEKCLQKICKPYRYKGEWFIDCEEVRKAFNEYDAFSDLELQKVKDWLKNKNVSLNESCKEEPFIEEKLYGIDINSLSKEWQDYIRYYKDRIAWYRLSWDLTGYDFNESNLRIVYNIDVNKLIPFPDDKFIEIVNERDELLNECKLTNKTIKELSNDLNNVEHQSTKEILDCKINDMYEENERNINRLEKLNKYINNVCDWFKKQDGVKLKYDFLFGN